MAISYNCTQNVSVIVCFAGRNQRVEINPKKCVVFKDSGLFNYDCNFKASDGSTYKVRIESIPNQEKGYSTHADIKVYRRSKLIADRKNLPVRFSRKLFA